jgi:hypothetical protein
MVNCQFARFFSHFCAHLLKNICRQSWEVKFSTIDFSSDCPALQVNFATKFAYLCSIEDCHCRLCADFEEMYDSVFFVL